MSKRPERYLNLSVCIFNYGDNNLFDDEYSSFKVKDDYLYGEIETLQGKTFTNALKIGRCMLQLLDGDPTYRKINKILKHSRIQFGRTQAIKYIEIYNYVNAKFKYNLSTDDLEELGVEKVYLLTTVKDDLMREKLEKFLPYHMLTVKQLTQLVSILNNQSEIFTIATNFLNEFHAEYDAQIEKMRKENPF